MALEILVTTAPDNAESLTLPDGTKMFEMLNDRKEAMALQLQELVSNIFSDIRKGLDVECEVQVSVSGKVNIAGEGGMTYLIFKIGGSASTETTMTITVKAAIKPSRVA